MKPAKNELLWPSVEQWRAECDLLTHEEPGAHKYHDLRPVYIAYGTSLPGAQPWDT